MQIAIRSEKRKNGRLGFSFRFWRYVLLRGDKITLINTLPVHCPSDTSPPPRDRAMTENSFRLTELAHGGGCGCKLAPAVLQNLLASQPATAPFAQLLVGNEAADDAAVWQIDDDTCVIATTDFFMPVVDDPRD